jgi:hypothetical protein
MTQRELIRAIPSQAASDGAGVKLRRSIGAVRGLYLDPFLERADGCVSPLPIDHAGLPCLDGSDCPPGLVCFPPGGFSPSPSCQVPAIAGCACPPGSTATAIVTASETHTVCAPDVCPARNTDVSALGRACASLRDCEDWMVCEVGAAGSVCALPCSSACACPGTTRCQSVVLPTGVSMRCVP